MTIIPEIFIPDDISDFQPPAETATLQEADDLVQSFSEYVQLGETMDYQVAQIRLATALAESCKQAASKATDNAKGFLRTVEYRRTLIYGLVTAAKEKGLSKGAIKGKDYTANVQATPGSLDISLVMEDWKDEVAADLTELVANAVGYINGTNELESEEEITQYLQEFVPKLVQAREKFSAYHNNPDYSNVLLGEPVVTASVSLAWDKKLITHHLKTNAIRGFNIVKGTALRLVLGGK